MKSKNRKQFFLVVFVIMIVITLFFGTGFTKRSDVWLVDHHVSEDGSVLTLKIAVAGSMGYIRDYNIKQEGDNKYLVFYSCFGGSNSNIGAKSEFEVEIEPACDEIYFYNGDGGYKLVLQRDAATNEWE